MASFNIIASIGTHGNGVMRTRNATRKRFQVHFSMIGYGGRGKRNSILKRGGRGGSGAHRITLGALFHTRKVLWGEAMARQNSRSCNRWSDSCVSPWSILPLK